RALSAFRDAVHHVDRQAGFVENIGHPKTVHLEGGRFERAGGDDEVALLGEDAADPVDHLWRLVRGADGENVVVLVPVIARLVGPHSREGFRDGRGFQADGGNVLEVYDV